MHISYPKTVYWFMDVPTWNVGTKTLVPWLPVDQETVETEYQIPSFFNERRRSNYSDVCHAKIVGVQDSIPLISGSRYLPTEYTGEVRNPWGAYAATQHVSFHMKESYCTMVTASVRMNGYGIITSEGTLTILWNQFRKYGNDIRTPAIYYRFRYDWDWRRQRMKRKDFASGGGTFGLPSDYASDLKDAIFATASIPTSGDDVMYEKLYNSLISLMSTVESSLPEFIQDWYSMDVRKGKRSWVVSPVPDDLPEIDDSVFLLREPGVIMYGESDLLYGRGTEKYFRDVLIQNSYMDLLRNVPKLNDNNIQNILSVVGFIKSVVIDHDLTLPKNLSSAWLQYRYRYQTGKLDLKEAMRFMKRHVSLPNSYHKAHGTSHLEYKGTDITCKSVASVIDRRLETTQKVWKALYTYGLSPSFYTVWDLIPYTFIIDWFIPIGDIALVWDTTKAFDEYYEIKDINFSLKYEVEKDDVPISCYTRWLAETPPALQGRYFLEDDTSSGTTLKRVVDAASLVIRR